MSLAVYLHLLGVNSIWWGCESWCIILRGYNVEVHCLLLGRLLSDGNMIDGAMASFHHGHSSPRVSRLKAPADTLAFCKFSECALTECHTIITEQFSWLTSFVKYQIYLPEDIDIVLLKQRAPDGEVSRATIYCQSVSRPFLLGTRYLMLAAQSSIAPKPSLWTDTLYIISLPP